MSADSSRFHAAEDRRAARASPRHDDHAALADLAFGSFSKAQVDEIDGAKPLALLRTDALQLDLSDPAQRQFGNYELLELIGEGGMGVVYRARQVSLDREVAIKLLAAGPWASRAFIERFLHEAQHAARMQHPNIVTVYEVGSAEGLHFFSMRLVRGSDLASTLRREGPFEPRRAAALMHTVAESVAYAHSLDVLHLDLKPANVLLDEDGQPHVADFGLARRLDRMIAFDNTEICGTPSYMAPEQAELGALTPATDIWGLGAVLYELVTGNPPFRGESAQATLKLLREGTLRRPRRTRRHLPLDLEAIIQKALAREPTRRYASARALADDLARFCEHRMVRARPLNAAQRTGRWMRREPKLAALAMLAFGALLLGLVATTQQWRRAESNAAVSSERLWESRRDAALRLQTDGKGFAALAPLLANIDEQEKSGRADAASVERREIGMILAQGVTLIDRMIVPDARPLASELSADGKLLAIAFGDQTVRWYDTATLGERGRVDLGGLSTSTGEDIAPRLLRFVDNTRLLVTLDWEDFLTSPTNRNTYLIDLAHARLLEPPAGFVDLSDVTYSAGARHALLWDRHGNVQFWQVDPWRPLSFKTGAGRFDVSAWLLGRGGRFALRSSGSNRINLALYDPHDLSAGTSIALPGFAQATAWTEDNAGSLVALGDSTGRVYILDPATGALRPLPAPPGSEVKWLAFSEDDAWLAVGRRDGAAFAFDVASGNPLNAGDMQQNFDVRQVAISHRERLLVAAGFGETALWRVPESGPTGLEATRLIASPAQSGALTNAVGTALQNGLLATADMSGEVRLWRLPRATVLPASPGQGTMSVAGNLYFDGEHLPDVAWNKVRIVSTRGATPTPWVELPQPIAYAELLDAGSSLLVTAGPAMYVFDAASMQLRYPPVALPANPIRMTAGGYGGMAIFAFGKNGDSGFEEYLRAYDLGSGRQRGGEETLTGPLRQFELSADASRLVAVGPEHGATDVLDSTTLHRIGSYPHNPEQPVIWTSFVPGSQRLWLVARDLDEATEDNTHLFAWNPAANSLLEQHTIPGSYPIGLTAAAGKPVLATADQGLLDFAAASPSNQRHLGAREESTSVFAVSHDRHTIAHVYGRDVQLFDAATLTAVGPPLRSNLGAISIPVSLAFSTDDRYLLGRSSSDNWLLWPLATDSRRLHEIRADAELLGGVPGAPRVLLMPGKEQSTRLRSRDPGPLPMDEDRPQPAAVRMIDGVAVPARPPGLDPLLLDLTDAYTAAPTARRNLLGTVMPTLTDIPWGVPHLDGIDYDVRGIIELRGRPGGTTTAGDVQSSTSGIKLPARPIAALHVLISAAQVTPIPDQRTYASIRLNYRNGSSAMLPIRTQREVPGYTDNDRPVPVAWAMGEHLRLVGFTKQALICNPRLANPHPERLIATLDLVASSELWSEPVFIAITAEPVIVAATSGMTK
ncbi:MAG: protein kinase [Lysobacterales bacterium]